MASFLEKKLSGYASSLEDDAIALDKLERLLLTDDDGRHHGLQGNETGDRIHVHANGGDDHDKSEEEKRKGDLRQTIRRRACALRVLLEDRLVIRDTFTCIKSQLSNS